MIGRRFGEQRVNQRDASDDLLDLAALQMTDEVPREEFAVRILLGNQLICTVLAHATDAGGVEQRQVFDREVLDGRHDLDTTWVASNASAGLGDLLLRGGDAGLYIVGITRHTSSR